MHAAYTSGHAALGVGSGNTPAIIDSTADIQMAVSSIMLSKTFDNGMICASEQSVVVEDSIYDAVRQEFAKRGAHILSKEDAKTAGEKIMVNGRLNVDIVGQPISKLAGILGLSNVPAGSRIIIGEASEVGKHEPWSTEKLSPLLAMYRASDFNAAVTLAAKLVDFAGAGCGGQPPPGPLSPSQLTCDRPAVSLFSPAPLPAAPQTHLCALHLPGEHRPHPQVPGDCEHRPHAHQHAGVAGGDRRRLQFPPGPVADARLRVVG